MPAAGDFKDHFSGHAAAYASARPRYPDELFACLASLCEQRSLAWDCATGNGQAAGSLAAYFERVIASDASDTQVSAAAAHAGVDYRVAPAEASGLAASSIDLVTVAQALHWFDIDAFFRETERVLRPRGVLAAWCYGNCEVDDAIDAQVRALYAELDPWWPPERIIVERGYRDIELPFEPLATPDFAMTAEWSAADMLAYLASWSATQRAANATGRDPLRTISASLPAAWGDAPRTVRWPLYMKAGRAA